MATIDLTAHSITRTATNLLSKIKLGNTVYYIRDAELEDLVKSFGTAAQKDIAVAIADNDNGLASGKQVYDYVTGAIGNIGQAMHFLGAFTAKPAPDAMDGEKPLYVAGDVIVVNAGDDAGKEFVLVEAGSPATKSWVELGNETGHVIKTTQIAGVAINDGITADALKNALGLKALAYWAAAEVKVSTIDSIDDITVAKSGEYNVASTAVAVPATYDALDVTPAGTITVSADTAAAVSYEKVKAGVAVSAVAPTGEQVANYTPAGSISLPSITMSHGADTKEDVATVTNAGTGYSIKEDTGTMTQAASTKTGKLIAQNTVTDETLVFTSEDVVTEVGAVTYVAPELEGALPTFGTKSVVTAVAADTAAYSGDASFTGTGVILSGTASTESATATVTQPTYTAEFFGTSKSVTPTVATTKNAAGSDAKVTIGTETVSINANSTEKTLPVTEKTSA